MHSKVINELRRIVEDSEIMAEDDALWPQPDRVGRQVNWNKIYITKVNPNHRG